LNLPDDVEPPISMGALVDVTTRAIEVLGTREKALHWLKTPVRSLGDRTSLSLLGSPDGITGVKDVLGRIEHGIW
jgi:putative toxin-antitoxin system antitoxin component (TIGR02293 family)